ncbi:hypothetical protein A2966_02950 [Candidatus Roizmanbacteria bacterium RIFCSPLOWO2_01_FULL_41_22]|uniref:Antitoxin n=1 Tax=Candidatus Roizmanbacteria bacterium RIFCSPLOWO2_01_FULL_41_22 TaxID=1802067 RepID=A0A1F7J7K0_9BACT|nr:MAG: hypothetical protein A2966_02950 [Candidatus Roizmanbacteria bacterium RIFCSPLOWO2_01_FULL_41_22]
MTKRVFPYITINTDVRFDKPVIEGTRVPVELIVGKIAGETTITEVMQEYDLTREQVLAALQYAAHLVSTEDMAIV